MTLQRFLNGMDQDTMKNDEVQRNLLDALRYFVGKIVEQQLSPKVPSREFVSALTGLVFTLIVDHLPGELIAFSKHANRKVIQDDDIFLFTRKTSLCVHLKEYRILMGDSPKKTISRSKKSHKSNDNDNNSLNQPIDALVSDDTDDNNVYNDDDN